MTLPPPYESQRNRGPGRRCGAAALAMVYRNFGIEIDGETLWDELCRDAKKPESSVSVPIRTLHLARNARSRGLAALPCRLRDPWGFLERLFSNENARNLRVVLNHRLREDSPLGHFTVPAGVDPGGETLFVHDPLFGPDRPLSRREILSLWTPRGPDCEISGNIVLLVAQEFSRSVSCPRCECLFGWPTFLLENPELFLRRFCPNCDAAAPLEGSSGR